jgi:hypothetical protein
MPQIDLPESVARWIASGERGISSETIVAHLYGLPITGRWGYSHPHDPSDLRRCLLLLMASPETVARFQEMASVSPEWRRLVAHWSEIERLFREECPNIHDCFGVSAHKTYAAMRSAINGGAKP